MCFISYVKENRYYQSVKQATYNCCYLLLDRIQQIKSQKWKKLYFEGKKLLIYSEVKSTVAKE